jgi:hypothetical protein
VVATASATPTRSGTITPTATLGPQPVGRSLALTYLGGRQVRLSWEEGTGTPVLLRISSQGPVAALAESPRSHVDSVPLDSSFSCYLVLAVAPDSRVFGTSDFLCVLPGSAAGFAARNFTLQLNQSRVASLSWEPAAGATGYLFLPVGTQRVQLLGATAVSITDHTGGELTCYVLVSQFGGTTSGITATVCAAPGVSTGFSQPALGLDFAGPALVLGMARR